MSKNWRPEDYHAPVPDTSTTESYDIGWCDGHEVGFDACLEALSKVANKYGTKWFRLAKENDTIVIYMD